jgi:hypothetical protein
LQTQGCYLLSSRNFQLSLSSIELLQVIDSTQTLKFSHHQHYVLTGPLFIKVRGSVWPTVGDTIRIKAKTSVQCDPLPHLLMIEICERPILRLHLKGHLAETTGSSDQPQPYHAFTRHHPPFTDINNLGSHQHPTKMHGQILAGIFLSSPRSQITARAGGCICRIPFTGTRETRPAFTMF